MKVKLFSAKRSGAKTFTMIAVCLILLVIPQTTFAGWLSDLGKVLTAVGVAAGALGAAPVAAGCVAGECVAILVDEVWLEPQVGEGTQPGILDFPVSSSFTEIEAIFQVTTYQPFPLPGDETDDFIIATNLMIERCNALKEHVAADAPLRQLQLDARDLSQAIRNVGVEYDKLGLDISITQEGLDSILADIEINGLPQTEIDFLQDAGWSLDDINAMQQYTTATSVNLAVPSVSVSEVFEAAADAVGQAGAQVPGLGLTGLIILSLLLLGGGALIIRYIA